MSKTRGYFYEEEYTEEELLQRETVMACSQTQRANVTAVTSGTELARINGHAGTRKWVCTSFQSLYNSCKTCFTMKTWGTLLWD